MTDSLAPAHGSASLKADRSLGNMYGTAFVGVLEYFEKRYGVVANNTVVAAVLGRWGQFVRPNTRLMGILGAKKYPNAFVGELVRAMAVAVRAPDEDAFIREIAIAGVDATLNTVARAALRYLVSPASVAARSPDFWKLFHDSGRLTITAITDRDFLSEVSEWQNHDVVVCKLGVEGGRRIVERTGAPNVTARREKCIAWGHDVCLTRVRWG